LRKNEHKVFIIKVPTRITYLRQEQGGVIYRGNLYHPTSSLLNDEEPLVSEGTTGRGNCLDTLDVSYFLIPKTIDNLLQKRIGF
jgi:hypothetical protein